MSLKRNRWAPDVLQANLRKYGSFERCSISTANNCCMWFIPCFSKSEHEKMLLKSWVVQCFLSMSTRVGPTEFKRCPKLLLERSQIILSSKSVVRCQRFNVSMSREIRCSEYSRCLIAGLHQPDQTGTQLIKVENIFWRNTVFG